MIREDVDPQSVFNSNHKKNALHATALNTSNANANWEKDMEDKEIYDKFNKIYDDLISMQKRTNSICKILIIKDTVNTMKLNSIMKHNPKLKIDREDQKNWLLEQNKLEKDPHLQAANIMGICMLG